VYIVGLASHVIKTRNI